MHAKLAQPPQRDDFDWQLFHHDIFVPIHASLPLFALPFLSRDVVDDADDGDLISTTFISMTIPTPKVQGQAAW